MFPSLLCNLALSSSYFWIDNGPFEDVFPIEDGDIPASYVSWLEGSIIPINQCFEPEDLFSLHSSCDFGWSFRRRWLVIFPAFCVMALLKDLAQLSKYSWVGLVGHLAVKTCCKSMGDLSSRRKASTTKHESSLWIKLPRKGAVQFFWC